VKAAAWVVLVVASGCVRSQSSSAAPVQDDQSIVFPAFYASPAVVVGQPGQTYALDGVMLRALMVAANDFIPPGTQAQSCWETLEAHGFQVVRQGDIVFVAIHADLARCGHPFLMLDSGVKYAIGADGRILRRVFDGAPEAPGPEMSSDAGDGKLFHEPGFPTVLKHPGDEAPRHWAPGWLDGGVPSSPDAGT
jgi:hypothetical protein